jgi:hypothetical protein
MEFPDRSAAQSQWKRYSSGQIMMPIEFGAESIEKGQGQDRCPALWTR